MKKIVPDTTCAIMTRDSRMNSAGGIELNVRTLLPFFDRVEVYDTGSIDGSREDLDKIASKNLFVYDIPWKGFADTRNEILKRIKTRRVFFIDDDELPSLRKIDDLVRMIEGNPSNGSYWFTFAQFLMWPAQPYFASIEDVMAHRLFDVSGISYESRSSRGYEDVVFESERTYLHSPAKILHFHPADKAIEWKNRVWYGDKAYMTQSPYETAKTTGWKQFNQWRLQYPLPEGLDIDKYLSERGVDTSKIITCKFVDVETRDIEA